MTTITFVRNQAGKIVHFVAEGHTAFAEAGSDIVCAAVSALTLAAINGLTDVVGISVGYEVRDGYAECVLPDSLGSQEAYGAQVLLETLWVSLCDLAAQHSAFLSIQEQEV